MLSPVLLTTLLAGAALAQAQDDCYREKTSCYGANFGNEIGHVPYFADIWACEMACGDTAGCEWFTWYENEGFYMCYLLTSCDSPHTDSHAISGMISECSPDTTPTKIPTWTPDMQDQE